MANLFDASSSHSDTRSCLVAMGYSARRDHQHISTDDHSPVGICGIQTEQHGCNCRPARAEHINGHWRHREYLLALYHSTATLSANAAIEVSVLNDPRILGVDNPARNRRLLFVGSYVVGCIIGAAMTFGTVGSLLFVCAIKLVISVSFLLNRGRAASRFPALATAGEEHHELDTPVVVKASWSD
jgi:hypothetical protein